MDLQIDVNYMYIKIYNIKIQYRYTNKCSGECFADVLC